MPTTFADKMAQVEQKNQAQRLQLANTFLPIFQSIAQKKAIDEQYALEQKRAEAERVRERSELSKGFAGMGITTSATAPIPVQTMQANRDIDEKDKLVNLKRNTDALIAILPADKKQEFDKRAVGLSDYARNALASSFAKEIEQTISDKRELAQYREKLKIAAQYDKTGSGSGSGSLPKPDKKHLETQSEMSRGKSYPVTVKETDKNGKAITRKLTMLVKQFAVPALGGNVLATNYNGRTFSFNGTSFFSQQGGVYKKVTPPPAVKDALYRGFSDLNATLGIADVSGQSKSIPVSQSESGINWNEYLKMGGS